MFATGKQSGYGPSFADRGKGVDLGSATLGLRTTHGAQEHLSGAERLIERCPIFL